MSSAAVLVGAALFIAGGILFIAFNESTPYTVLTLLGVLLLAAGRFAQRRQKQLV